MAISARSRGGGMLFYFVLVVGAMQAAAFQSGAGTVSVGRSRSMELAPTTHRPRASIAWRQVGFSRLVLQINARASANNWDMPGPLVPVSASFETGATSTEPFTSLQAQSSTASGGGQGKPFQLPIKQIALLCLVLQNACQMLSMRYSRIALTSSVPYLASTAVVSSELLKLIACLVILAFEYRGRLPQTLWNEIIVNWRMTAKVGVPALIYMVQNNLLFLAASNLDAATCQITYQLKILTTAVFAVTMLGKHITPVKWGSLIVLIAGIVMVQAPSLSAGAGKAAHAAGNPAVGLAAVIAACFLSGFAGIWFEKILKGSDTSIWIRNIQLGGIGCLGALAAAFWKDGAAIQAAGFFQGYTPLVWSVVGQVGLGGLLVAMVVKYADNILKGFATSLSIIVSGLLSIYFIPALKFAPSPIWFAGTTLVLAATVLYSIPDRQPPKKQAA